MEGGSVNRRSSSQPSNNGFVEDDGRLPPQEPSNCEVASDQAQPPRGYVRTSNVVAARIGNPQAMFRIVSQATLPRRSRRLHDTSQPLSEHDESVAAMRNDRGVSVMQRVMRLLHREIDEHQEFVPVD